MKRFEVKLLRANGRFVKSKIVRSRYAAKELRRRWEEKYDHTYRIELNRLEEVS
jgi:hypothetical protein